jgi:hypothetical protein
MAVTVEKVIDFKPSGDQFAFPVASGETIYQGTIACLDDDGYLRNLSSTYAPQAKLVVFVADGSANDSGPAATTSAGSISGSLEAGTAAAGDKTVRRCYVSGLVRATFTSIAQKQIGKTVYATDNFTVDEAQNNGVKIGTLVTYISATEGWIDLNKFYQHDGTIFWKQAITASTGAAGGLFNIANPTGATIMVTGLAIDITTGSSGAITVDAGCAATSTSADTLIDGAACSLAIVLDNIGNHGTNGGVDKCASSEYITGTLSGASATIVGTVGIWYRYWE